MEENVLKGDIYNGSDFTARKELRQFEMPEEPRWNGGSTGGRGGETAL